MQGGGSPLEREGGISTSQWLLNDNSLDQMHRGKIICVCARFSQVQITIIICERMKKLPEVGPSPSQVAHLKAFAPLCVEALKICSSSHRCRFYFKDLFFTNPVWANFILVPGCQLQSCCAICFLVFVRTAFSVDAYLFPPSRVCSTLFWLSLSVNCTI